MKFTIQYSTAIHNTEKYQISYKINQHLIKYDKYMQGDIFEDLIKSIILVMQRRNAQTIELEIICSKTFNFNPQIIVYNKNEYLYETTLKIR